jgi:hypothetical protein
MDSQELEALLLAVAHGWATPAEIERLEHALKANDAFRVQAAEWLCDESILRHELPLLSTALVVAQPSSNANALVKRHLTDNPAETSLWRNYNPWLYAAAVVLACSIGLNFYSWHGGRQRVHLQQTAAVSVRLAKATGCVWGDAERANSPPPGYSIQAGEQLRLLQGIAELQVQSGNVTGAVRLQGPCIAVLGADGIPLLKSGRAVFDLNVYAGTCSIGSPVGPIELAESASFGMLASDEGAEVHVFDGQVRIPGTDGAQEGVPKPPVMEASRGDVVREGASAIIQFSGGADTQTRWSSANPSLFAEEQSMLTDQLDIDSDYASRVKASRPVGYWRFSDWPTTEFTNEAPDGEPLRVGGEVATVVQGSNSVLEFGMTRESGFLYLDKPWPKLPLSEFAVEVWIKPSHFQNAAVVGLISPGPSTATHENHAMLIELGGPDQLVYTAALANSLRYLLRDPPSEDANNEYGQSVQNVYQVRRWQHVVYVKHKDRIELYLNGEKIATDECSGQIAAAQTLVCGTLYLSRVTRPFVGQLDELAIYEHALSEQEVKDHFHFGRTALIDGDSI